MPNWTAPHFDANGFTIYEPSWPTSGPNIGAPSGLTTAIIYVSDTEGHNSNTGFSYVANANPSGAGEAGPKKSLNDIAIFTFASPQSFQRGQCYTDSVSGGSYFVSKGTNSSTTCEMVFDASEIN